MKLWGIFRFELAYQVGRVPIWVYFAVLVFFGFAQIVGGSLPGARSGGYFLNAPFVIAQVTVFCTLIWLLVAVYVAGDAAARDVETGMHPLSYSTPVSKADYLGGRFLAAFVLNAVILLGVPVGIWLGLHAPEVEAEVVGPFQPLTYLTAYALIAVPTAFVGTAVQFGFATLGRRAIAGFVGAVLLLVTTMTVIGAVALLLDRNVAPWLDPIGVMGMFADNPVTTWTTVELNTRLTWLNNTVLANRLLWIGIGLALLVFTHVRFRFRHPVAAAWWSLLGRRGDAQTAAVLSTGTIGSRAITVPQVQRAFDLRTRVRQVFAIAWEAFVKVLGTRTSLALLAVVALFALAGVADPELFGIPRVPLDPRTDYVLFGLWNPGFPPGYLIIPVLIVYWSGELIWREREAGLAEMVDAAPVSEGVLFLGKVLALGLLLAMCITIRMVVGVSVQAAAGYFDFGFGQYAQLLFGIQLTDYLLLSLLALVVHAVLNQKHVGHVVAIVAVVLGVAGTQFGIDDLLAYGSHPNWSYSAMRGFGSSLDPWRWYTLYWTAWAALLAVGAILLWVRGTEEGLGPRLRTARRRATRGTMGTTAVAVAIGLASGGFIYYNTNVLAAAESPTDRIERAAEYERRYGRFANAPQPRLKGTSLVVEIHPERRRVEVRGTYRLTNDGPAPIDSVHLAPASDVETSGVAFDRPATLRLEDEDVGHRIYALQEALQPGDSLRLNFEVRYEPRGFPHRPVDASVVANGTLLSNREWLPAVGYQRMRELRDVAVRKAHGLASRPALPSLFDPEARRYLSWAGERIDFEAVVGTVENQVAIAPGLLRETWSEDGRRYFRYSTDAPIGNEYTIASADYARHDAAWRDVAIQIFHDPRHVAQLNRTVRSVRASLDFYSEQFGPYPYAYIRFVEQAGLGFGLHADASTILYREWFTLMHPERAPGGADVPFAIVAHEVAHQWWGTQLQYALVEGAGVLSESLAWYSAIGVVERTLGREEMHRLLSWMRRPYPAQPENVPLLQARGDYLLYRKGPFAMYALSEYVGQRQINTALRTLLETYPPGSSPAPTTLDLYRELQAVTPDSLQYLLHDLFEANTYWELATEPVTAIPTETGHWRVTLDVRARKVVVDTAGVETERPMDDWVQIGIFASDDLDRASDEPLHLRMHRIRSGEQTITITVPREPDRAGIDPYHLLIDLDVGDNVGDVAIDEGR